MSSAGSRAASHLVVLVVLFAPSAVVAARADDHTPTDDAPPEAPIDARDVDWLVPDLHHATGLGVRYSVVDGQLLRTRDGDAPALVGNGRPPEYQRDVIAVVADEANHFLTITADGLMQHHDDGHWDDLWGLPPLRTRRTILPLPIPTSSLRPGKIAYSQRHQNVGYYEDTVGSQFHWGIAGCTSVYVLSDDGAHLLFADPWIPADFSREVMLPVVDEGDGPKMVLGASIAASASTLMLLARDGGVYVRFDDYDHNGGTPFYHYRYVDDGVEALPEPLKGDDPRSELQVRALPGFGWQKLPDIPRSGAARLSTRIAIAQTGLGNSTRLLRILGDDADGVHGVYELRLDDDTGWQFRALPHSQGRNSAWLDASLPSRTAKPALAYVGRIMGPVVAARGLPHIAARTDDFWFHDGRFTLTLQTGDDIDIPLVVDVVDAWTLFQNDNAATDVRGVKSLKATVRLARPEVLTPAARVVVDTLLADTLGVPFGAAIVASQDHLTLVPVSRPWNTDRQTWRLELQRVPTSDFQPRRQRHFFVDDETFEVLTREAAGAGFLEAALPAATTLADALTVVTTTRWTLRDVYWLTGFEAHLPAVLAAQRLSADLKLRQAVRGPANTTAPTTPNRTSTTTP